MSLNTPVLIRGARVFAGGWQQHGYIDAVLLALDLESGEPVWHQLVASSQMEGTMFGELAREPLASALTERDGVIYFPTNLGAVAALEAATGRILWLATYDTIEVRPPDGRRSEFRKVVWGVNPPLLWGETLIVTPRDSVYLYAIDCAYPPRTRGGEARQPGKILWTYSNSGGELRDLLGCIDGVIYFTGPGGVQALDIRQGAPKRIRSPLTQSDEGRGALTDSGVVVASRGGPLPPGGARNLDPSGDLRLWLLDPALENLVDLSGPLPASEQGTPGGNVTVGLGRVILTSRDLVAAFAPRDARPQAGAGGTASPGGAPKPDREERNP